MASKIKVDTLETANGSGTIALSNQLSGMTTASLPALGSAQMPTGSVLQVVQITSVVQSTSTSGSDVDFLTAAITPTSASSKILISTTFFIGRGNNETYYMSRNGTKIGGVATGGGSFISIGSWYNSDEPAADSAATLLPMNYEYLDSPSSSSEVTYKIGHMSPNSPTFFINRPASSSTAGRGTMTLTLTEIKG